MVYSNLPVLTMISQSFGTKTLGLAISWCFRNSCPARTFPYYPGCLECVFVCIFLPGELWTDFLNVLHSVCMHTRKHKSVCCFYRGTLSHALKVETFNRT